MLLARTRHSYPDTISRGRLSSVPLSLLLLSAGLADASRILPAMAQTAATVPQAATAAPDADTIKQREQELEATRAQVKSAAEARERLKADVAAIGQDQSKLNAQLIDVAGRGGVNVETRVGDAEARLRTLNSREAQISRLARFAPFRNCRGAGGPATGRPAHAASPAGPP